VSKHCTLQENTRSGRENPGLRTQRIGPAVPEKAEIAGLKDVGWSGPSAEGECSLKQKAEAAAGVGEPC